MLTVTDRQHKGLTSVTQKSISGWKKDDIQ